MLQDELCRHWQLKGLPCPLHNSELIQIRAETIASYPGLLTPVFVPCSTNAGRDLVKVSDMQWRTWMCGGVAHSFCTAVKRLPESKKRHQDCLMSSAQSFYGPCLRFVAHSLAVFLGTCHSSKCPVCHCTWLSFTSRVSTASDKCWSEK